MKKWKNLKVNKIHQISSKFHPPTAAPIKILFRESFRSIVLPFAIK